MSQKIVDIARKELGYKEFPANSNKTKYGKWFGLDGVAWCAIFVSWCYDKAGYPLGNIGFPKGFAGCQTGFAHWSKTKEITKDPQPGDIVLFDWNKDGRYDHAGIFIKDLGNGYFQTIEGNTSATNQSNGGEVQERKRKYDCAIFIHPKILNIKK
jgi:cell wall-associated NlpC family hydrolase